MIIMLYSEGCIVFSGIWVIWMIVFGVGWGIHGNFKEAKDNMNKKFTKRNVVSVEKSAHVDDSSDDTTDDGDFDVVMPVSGKDRNGKQNSTVSDEPTTLEESQNILKEKLGLLTCDSLFNGMFPLSTVSSLLSFIHRCDDYLGYCLVLPMIVGGTVHVLSLILHAYVCHALH